MTNKEAIEYLNNHYMKHIKYLSASAEEVDKHNEVMDLAIEALEKQIPKKPYVGNYGGKCWCPSCNDEDEMDIYGTSYCPNCGQALDWSESKWKR